MPDDIAPVLIDGQWRPADAASTFAATNPETGDSLPAEYPVSRWSDLDAALDAAAAAFEQIDGIGPDRPAAFLNRYADALDAATPELAEIAQRETALPAATRLAKIELPRTTNQLRLSAKAARDGDWALPTIDTEGDIRSMLVPIGPTVVFGPNNFPFAYHGIAGGDFASAVAVGNPVIAKAHPLHPGTSKRLAEIAKEALDASDLPPATVQFLYHFSNGDGLKLAGDRRVGAIGFTGSRKGGLALKAAADEAGIPAYLEMSSVNPVVLLPNALASRGEQIVEDYVGSCLLATGQFCTNPGLVLAVAGEATETFVKSVAGKFDEAPAGTLFSRDSVDNLKKSVDGLTKAGASVVTGGNAVEGPAAKFQNTLLRTTGKAFLNDPAALQSEAFGNVGMVVVCESVEQIAACLRHVEGNLTGSIYSADGDAYGLVEAILRRRVGRLMNDKMPTGVAVSPAQVHGGPYPSTGHGGFTAVGPPAALRRFAQLRCYDHVPADRLPPLLQDRNPGDGFRYVDGAWTRG